MWDVVMSQLSMFLEVYLDRIVMTSEIDKEYSCYQTDSI